MAKPKLKMTVEEIRAEVKRISRGYVGVAEGDYHGFVHDGPYSDWESLFARLGYQCHLEYDENDYVSGIVVVSGFGQATLVEPYEVGGGPDGLEWVVTDKTIDACVACIVGLSVPRGSPLQIARAAVADLRRARDRLVSIGAVRAAARVRAALRSADGAVRHAALAPYRSERQAKARDNKAQHEAP